MREKTIIKQGISLALVWIMTFYPLLASAALKSLDDDEMASVDGKQGIEISGDFGEVYAEKLYYEGANDVQVAAEGVRISEFSIDPTDPITVNVEKENDVERLVIRSPENPAPIDVSVEAVRVGPAPNNTSMGGLQVNGVKSNYVAKIAGCDGVCLSGEVTTSVDEAKYIGATEDNTFNFTGIDVQLIVADQKPITIDMTGGLGDRRLTVAGAVEMPYLTVQDIRFGSGPNDDRMFGLEIMDTTASFETNWVGKGPTTGVGINMYGLFEMDTGLVRLIGENAENTTNLEGVHIAATIKNFDVEVIEEGGLGKLAISTTLTGNANDDLPDMLFVDGIRFGHSDNDEYIGGLAVSDDVNINSYVELYGMPGGVGIGFEGSIDATIGNIRYLGKDPEVNTANLNNVYLNAVIAPSYFEVAEKDGQQWGHLFTDVTITEASVRDIRFGSGQNDNSLGGAGLLNGQIVSDVWIAGGGVEPGTAGVTVSFNISSLAEDGRNIDRLFLGGHEYMENGDLNNTFNFNNVNFAMETIEPMIFEVVTQGDKQYLHIDSPNTLISSANVQDIRLGTTGSDASLGGAGLINATISSETWLTGGGVLPGTPGINFTTTADAYIERLFLGGEGYVNGLDLANTFNMYDVEMVNLTTVEPVFIEVITQSGRQALHIVAPNTTIDQFKIGDIRAGISDNDDSFGSAVISGIQVLDVDMSVFGDGFETGTGIVAIGNTDTQVIIDRLRYKGANKGWNNFDINDIDLTFKNNFTTMEIIEDAGKQKLALYSDIDFDLHVGEIGLKGLALNIDEPFVNSVHATDFSAFSRTEIYGGHNGNSNVGVTFETTHFVLDTNPDPDDPDLKNRFWFTGSSTLRAFNFHDIYADLEQTTSIAIIGGTMNGVFKQMLEIDSAVLVNEFDINDIRLGAKIFIENNDSFGGFHATNLYSESTIQLAGGAPETGTGLTLMGDVKILPNPDNATPNRVWLSGQFPKSNQLIAENIGLDLHIYPTSIEVYGENGGSKQKLLLSAESVLRKLSVESIRVGDGPDDRNFGGLIATGIYSTADLEIYGGAPQTGYGLTMTGNMKILSTDPNDPDASLNRFGFTGENAAWNTFNFNGIEANMDVNHFSMEIIGEAQNKIALDVSLSFKDNFPLKGFAIQDIRAGGLFDNLYDDSFGGIAFNGDLDMYTELWGGGTKNDTGIIFTSDVSLTDGNFVYTGAQPWRTFRAEGVTFHSTTIEPITMEIAAYGLNQQQLAIYAPSTDFDFKIETLRVGDYFNINNNPINLPMGGIELKGGNVAVYAGLLGGGHHTDAGLTIAELDDQGQPLSFLHFAADEFIYDTDMTNPDSYNSLHAENIDLHVRLAEPVTVEIDFANGQFGKQEVVITAPLITGNMNTFDFFKVENIGFDPANGNNVPFVSELDINGVALSAELRLAGMGSDPLNEDDPKDTGIGVRGDLNGSVSEVILTVAENNQITLRDLVFSVNADKWVVMEVDGDAFGTQRFVTTFPGEKGDLDNLGIHGDLAIGSQGFQDNGITIGDGEALIGQFALEYLYINELNKSIPGYNITGQTKLWGNGQGINFSGNVNVDIGLARLHDGDGNDKNTSMRFAKMRMGMETPDDKPISLTIDTPLLNNVPNGPTRLKIEFEQTNTYFGVDEISVGSLSAESMGGIRLTDFVIQDTTLYIAAHQDGGGLDVWGGFLVGSVDDMEGDFDNIKGGTIQWIDDKGVMIGDIDDSERVVSLENVGVEGSISGLNPLVLTVQNGNQLYFQADDITIYKMVVGAIRIGKDSPSLGAIVVNNMNINANASLYAEPGQNNGTALKLSFESFTESVEIHDTDSDAGPFIAENIYMNIDILNPITFDVTTNGSPNWLEVKLPNTLLPGKFFSVDNTRIGDEATGFGGIALYDGKISAHLQFRGIDEEGAGIAIRSVERDDNDLAAKPGTNIEIETIQYEANDGDTVQVKGFKVDNIDVSYGINNNDKPMTVNVEKIGNEPARLVTKIPDLHIDEIKFDSMHINNGPTFGRVKISNIRAQGVQSRVWAH